MMPHWNAACYSSNMTHMRRAWPHAKTELASSWHEWRRSDMWRAGAALLAQHPFFFFFTYLVYVRWQDLSLSTSVLGAEVLVFSLARFKHWTIWESICAYTLTVLVLMNQLWAAAAWLWHQLDEKKPLHDCLSSDDMPGLAGCLFLSASMEVEGVHRHAPTHSPETQSYSFYKSPLNLICSLHRL